MESKFKVGDRVVILGHPTGKLKDHIFEVRDALTNGSYVNSMDEYVGEECSVVEVYLSGTSSYNQHYRYYLDNNDYYWTEDWIDFAEPPVNCFHLEIANLL